MIQRIRVYQLAREFGVSPKLFEATVRSQGIEIKNYMSTLSSADASKVRAHVRAHVESKPAPTATTPVLRRTREQARAPSAPDPAAAGAEPAPLRSRVIRDDRGVIVGTQRRSGPTILGFIPVPPRPRKTRVQAVAAKPEIQGRASRQKQRELKRREVGRRRSTLRRRGRTRSAPANTAAPRRQENREVRIEGTVRAGDLAREMGVKASDVLRELWRLGLRRTTINHYIDAQTATLVADHFDFRVQDVGFKEEQYVTVAFEGGERRAPVVTVLGHVDHGKTTLLDTIRQADVATTEAGGITQHLGSYRVGTATGDVLFLDTPGHEAFASMRIRGANVTDIAVLVVAADDGVMPTTIASIRAAQQASVPIVVALNKIDRPEANPGRVKQQLMEHGLVGAEFGGDVAICEVSALTGVGVPDLLGTLAAHAESLDLRAPATGAAQAVVLEARVDRGRGPISTVLVQQGALKIGSFVVAGELRGKVRFMVDTKGRGVEVAGPSTVVSVSGLNGLAEPGQSMVSVDDERIARQIVEHRARSSRRTHQRRNVLSIQDFLRRRHVPVLRVVLKGDHRGTVEAIAGAIEAMSTDRVRAEIVARGVGGIAENDVKLARAGGAVVLGFNVSVGPRASALAAAEGIETETVGVIYELLDEVRARLIALLEPEHLEQATGSAEVRALFRVPRVGVVAGCRVTAGTIRRNSHARVIRAGEVVFDGRVSSLRILADDVSVVDNGRECGIGLATWDDLREGDQISAYEMTQVAPSLG